MLKRVSPNLSSPSSEAIVPLKRVSSELTKLQIETIHRSKHLERYKHVPHSSDVGSGL